MLPPVELRGVGTATIESTDVYVTRLAHTAGIKKESLRKYLGTEAPRTASWKYDHERYQVTQRKYFATLEALTGCANLECGSFFKLENVVHTKSLSTRFRRWCPQCYLEWTDESWEPLIWRTDIKQTCVRHDCLMEDKCRHCGAPQSQRINYENRRSCSRCSAPLGGKGATVVQTDYEKWVEVQVCDVVMLCATREQPALPPNTLALFLEGLWELTRLTGAIPPALFLAARLTDPRTRLPKAALRSIINLSSLQAVSVTGLLLDPKGAASASLFEVRPVLESIQTGFGVKTKGAKLFLVELARELHIHEREHLSSVDMVLRVMEMNNDRARSLIPQTYTKYYARYFCQGSVRERRRVRHALLVALRMSHPQRRGDKRIKIQASWLANYSKISCETAEVVIRSARMLCRISVQASALLAQARKLSSCNARETLCAGSSPPTSRCESSA
jgi:hypothetical protein